MSTRALQALKQHRFHLPWLLIKKFIASVVRIETLVLFRRALDDVSHHTAPGLDIVPANDAASQLFRRLCAKYPEKNFQERLGLRGRNCYVALRNGDIAGYGWLSTDSLYVDEIACTYPLAPGEVFIYDCFVDDAYRGQGIYPAILEATLSDCSKRSDIHTAVIGAISVNQASIRGIRKAGFKEWKRIHYVEWGRRQHWWGLDACGNAA